MTLEEFSEELYEMSEKTTYDFIDKFNSRQRIDESITYVYIKAFYMHVIKLFLDATKNVRKFDRVYQEYKMILIEYYKKNNNGIYNEFLEDINEAFDKSFEMMQSLNFKELYDGYEFRHHIIMCFELLRSILEKKSEKPVRVDIFEDYISTFRRQAETVLDYVSARLKHVK